MCFVTFSKTLQVFTEQWNGLYGPYEHILQVGFEIIWSRQWVVEENWKYNEVKQIKIQFWGPRFVFWGVFKDEMMFKTLLWSVVRIISSKSREMYGRSCRIQWEHTKQFGIETRNENCVVGDRNGRWNPHLLPIRSYRGCLLNRSPPRHRSEWCLKHFCGHCPNKFFEIHVLGNLLN